MWDVTMFNMLASNHTGSNLLGDNPVFLMFVFVSIILILLIITARLSLSLRQTRAVLETRTEELLFTMQSQQNESVVREKAEEAETIKEETEDVLYGRLFVVKGLETREIPIKSEMFTIGRSADNGCDFVIDKPFVSPKHCIIFHKDGVFSVKDLDSKNGVFINGERVARGREIIIPIGSEVELTKHIVLELWDPHTMIEFESDTNVGVEGDDAGIGHVSEELIFKPLLDVRYVADEGAQIDDNYSPI